MSSPLQGAPVVPVLPSGYLLVDALLRPQRWATGDISYSFVARSSVFSTDANSGYGDPPAGLEPYSASFAPLSDPQRDAFVLALARWADVADLRFTQVQETAGEAGVIRTGWTAVPFFENAGAWTYYPWTSERAGDIWFNARVLPPFADWPEGSFAFFAAVHEIGHALGLKHPVDGDVHLPAQLDNRVMTVMSTAGGAVMPLDFAPTTPMLLDVAAIQHLYGPNLSYHAGDDTYRFDDARTHMETLWDAGGIDTLQYDGAQPARLNLIAGQGSVIGNRVHLEADPTALVENVWLAFGVDIENATGGSAGDVLTGNALDNVLTGRGGDDALWGYSGADTARYEGVLSQFRFERQADGSITVTDRTGREGTDILHDIERAVFADHTVNLEVAQLAAALPQPLVRSVVELYVAFFERVPDGDGMAYWLREAAAGRSLDAIADAFYDAATHFSALTGYSPSASDADFVGRIYRHVLGRDTPDAEGLAFWTQALAQGTQTRGALVHTVLGVAHGLAGDPQLGGVARLLDQRIAAGLVYGVEMGLGQADAEAAVAEGMAIAHAVAADGLEAAIRLIGLDPADFTLG